ncbi:phosphoadenosine phosphosulfate reductase [Lysobacter arseniciresistens ZS79]|uniref:Phosphoadenosine 5'-phosphosulfate reductase n=1 Tax=Lysobacter arseniciresistens ZS79 TaxID=913325 RepID=A0A0A0F195_9GAMM|nr:phosphoadenylyl-sulfate reductase [Lysobacter arseniciresistens]KGM56916.1 phosphoadenosine phosphosulfate reductase [Lysobacter arseniciresistens ZS79]
MSAAAPAAIPAVAPTAAPSARALREINHWLAGRTAEQRVAWSLESTAGAHVLSSSFGAQAAVSLHMVTRQAPGTPVILVDTGYLFPETYRFIDELRERLALDLRVYRPDPAQAWSRAEVAELQAAGVDAIHRYNQVHKVEPMQRALAELGVGTWIAGLRRSQSRTRAGIDLLARRDGRWKLHPLADWSDRDIWHYLQRHGLPYHPLWHEGYVSIGDVHSTRPLEPGMHEQDTRFFGLTRECGLHFDSDGEQAA